MFCFTAKAEKGLEVWQALPYAPIRLCSTTKEGGVEGHMEWPMGRGGNLFSWQPKEEEDERSKGLAGRGRYYEIMRCIHTRFKITVNFHCSSARILAAINPDNCQQEI